MAPCQDTFVIHTFKIKSMAFIYGQGTIRYSETSYNSISL
uniref:Uncharacterized protein n=1 Tax=Anguilla anguilla TaxID=7936 RepID=A0A0E9VU94_ANGAN